MSVVKNMMVRVGADFSSLVSGSKAAASTTQQWATATTSAFAQVETGARRLETTTGVLDGIVGRLGRVVSFAAVVGGIRQCIDAASDLTEVQNVVDKSFGSLSGQAEEFAATAISSFGLTELQAKQYSANFMAMGKSMGLAEQQAADMAIQLAGLSGDVASFFNLDQDAAYTKLKSIFTGETQALKEIGVVMTEANLQAYALSQGITKSVSAMSQDEKVLLRYGYVMQTLAYAQGDFASTSSEWANNVRVLKNQFDSLISVLGRGFIAILNPIVTVLNSILSSLVSFANGIADVLSSVFGTESASVSASLGAVDTVGLDDSFADIAAAAFDAADGVNSVGSAAKGATSAAKELAAQTLGFDKITKLSGAGSSGSGSGSGGGSKYSGGTGGSVVSGLGITSTSAEAAGSVLDGVLEKTNAFSGAMGRFRDYLSGLDFTPLQTAWENLKTAGGKLADVLSEGLSWGWTNVLQPLGEWTLQEGVPTTLTAFSAGFSALSDVLEACGPTFDYNWTHYYKPAFEWLGNSYTNSMAGWTRFFEGVSSIANGDVLSAVDKLRQTVGTWIFGAEETDAKWEIIMDLREQRNGVDEDGPISNVQAAWDILRNGPKELGLFANIDEYANGSKEVGAFDRVSLAWAALWGGKTAAAKKLELWEELNGSPLDNLSDHLADVLDFFSRGTRGAKLEIYTHMNQSGEELAEKTAAGWNKANKVVYLNDIEKNSGKTLAEKTAAGWNNPRVYLYDYEKNSGHALAAKVASDWTNPKVYLYDQLKNSAKSLADGFQKQWGKPTVSVGITGTTSGGKFADDFASAFRLKTTKNPLKMVVDWVKNGLTSDEKSVGKALFGEAKYPKLRFAARGGVLDRATYVRPDTVGGEYGKEALLPLEHNTEWMDTWSQKAASALVQMLGGVRTGERVQSQPIYLVMPDGRVLGQTLIDWIDGEAQQGRYPLAGRT